MIDVPAIRAEVDEAKRQLDQEAVARGRRALEGEVDASPEGVPGVPLQGVREQLAQLTKLRRALDAGQIAPTSISDGGARSSPRKYEPG